MQQRVTPKSLIAENKRKDYGRVRKPPQSYSVQSIRWTIPISVTNIPRVHTRITH